MINFFNLARLNFIFCEIVNTIDEINLLEQTKLLPIILSGGSGSRLWPLSRKSFPKQYLSIDNKSKYSFLQSTLNRIKDLNKENNPIIICNEEHRFITAEQVRIFDINPSSILLEPCSRNTASSVAIAAIHSISKGEDPTLLILPSDHQIKNQDEFMSSIRSAYNFVNAGKILTFGVKPMNPSTGYGYIQSKGSLLNQNRAPSQIMRFIEKPEKSIAEKLFQDDSFSWNSGIFMFKASTIIKELEKYCPKVLIQSRESYRNKIEDLDFLRLEKESFEKAPNISIDKAVMEKTDLGYVYPLDASWSDIGGWKSFWENSSKDSNGNVILGDSMQIESNNSLIASYSRLTVALGVNDLIIIETNDAVLVAKKDQSENIKELVQHLKDQNRIESEESKKVYRPWGNYLSLEEDNNWKIKKIEINPGASISLQLHNKRTEHWIVVKGTANVEINEKIFVLNENQSCFIPKGHKHRLSNISKETLTIIEIQSGTYLGEDDIIRFEDKYGRNKN